MPGFVPTNGSLYRQFETVVKRQGLCVAIVTEEQTITYVALRTAIDNCAASFTTRGIQRGQTIAVNFTRPEFYTITLFAANRIGAGLVFANRHDVDRMATKPDWILTDDRMPQKERQGALVMDKSWAAPQPNSAPAPVNYASDSLVYWFGTSGSTGMRKFVRVSERNLLTRMPSQQYYIHEDTRLLCTIGARTTIWTEMHVTALLSGGSAVMIRPQVQNLPYYIDLFGVNTLLTTPMILEDMMSMELPKDIYRNLECIAITGAAASGDSLERIRRRMCDTIILSYGSTEKGGTARFRYNREEYAPGIVGQISDGIEVEIVDGENRPVEAGTEGTVRIRRDKVVLESGYTDDAEENEKHFVDHWFYPGDIGRFDDNDNLIIAGRDDNVINAGGNKYGLELIETEIENRTGKNSLVMPGTGPGSAAYLIVFVQAGNDIDTSEVVDAIQKRFKRVLVDRIFAVDAIAMTEAGKKDRMTMARLLENDAGTMDKIYDA